MKTLTPFIHFPPPFHSPSLPSPSFHDLIYQLSWHSYNCIIHEWRIHFIILILNANRYLIPYYWDFSSSSSSSLSQAISQDLGPSASGSLYRAPREQYSIKCHTAHTDTVSPWAPVRTEPTTSHLQVNNIELRAVSSGLDSTSKHCKALEQTTEEWMGEKPRPMGKMAANKTLWYTMES